MKFLIHYLVRTPLTPLHFDIVVGGPITADANALDELRMELAVAASLKIRRSIAKDDIIIANIMPIPDGDESAKQTGGS